MSFMSLGSLLLSWGDFESMSYMTSGGSSGMSGCSLYLLGVDLCEEWVVLDSCYY